MPPQNYAVRLRAPAKELLPVCAEWALKCDKVLMYEHPEPNNIHCHFLLTGYYGSVESLKGAYKRLGLVLKGPGQVSFKTTFKAQQVVIEIKEDTWGRYITYMTKGIYDPAYNKGFDPVYLETCKKQWKDLRTYTKDEQHNIDYVEYCHQQAKKHGMTIDDLDLGDLRTYAIKFAASVSGGNITTNARKIASMCYTTYGFNTGLIKAQDIILPFEPLRMKK